MRRRLRHFGLITLLLGSVALGCTRSAVQHKEPPDPLLVTKKPVEGRPQRADTDPAYEAPPAPPADREPLPIPVPPGTPILPAGAPARPSGLPWPLPTNR
jgi:hypothetical protein